MGHGIELKRRVIENQVKRQLDLIILSLLAKRAMCGKGIKKEIFTKFGVILSSGTIYPTLYKLKSQNLLECREGIKTKRYNVKEEAWEILRENSRALNFFCNFLETAGGGSK